MTIQKRITDILRHHFEGKEMVSWDDLEGVDKRRDCFMVIVSMTDSGAQTVHYAIERYEVSITYYAPLFHSSVAMDEAQHKLNSIFAREFSYNGDLLFVQNKEALMTENALDFSFEFEYRRALKPPFHDEYVTEPNEKWQPRPEDLELIEEVHFNTKED